MRGCGPRGADPEPQASGSVAVGSLEISAGQSITNLQLCVVKNILSYMYKSV